MAVCEPSELDVRADRQERVSERLGQTYAEGRLQSRHLLRHRGRLENQRADVIGLLQEGLTHFAELGCHVHRQSLA